MRTRFTDKEREDPLIAEAETYLRGCVHCGFCASACPTYALLGDERDSPRGRIVLIKEMLESGEAGEETTRHMDRCLSCFACMEACPSGVDYLHLSDLARAHIHKRSASSRPWRARLARFALRHILPSAPLLRIALLARFLARPLRFALPSFLKRLMDFPPPAPLFRILFPPSRQRLERRQERSAKPPMRLGLLTGCAQETLAPQINEATANLLGRLGAEVILPKGSPCCGAMALHMGDREGARARARHAIEAFRGLDAIVSNAAGCGAVLKDAGHLLRDDPEWGAEAKDFSSRVRDLSEILPELGFEGCDRGEGIRVSYHGACGLHHAQGVKDIPSALLKACGFTVLTPPEAHMCCGWAGTYHALQSELSESLKERKAAALNETGGHMVAAANMGCLLHLGPALTKPVFHIAQLLDWALGGDAPQSLRLDRRARADIVPFNK